MTVLVLAPHPDDFDAVGVTLRRLHERGHAVHLAVLTEGANGVDDGFEGAVTSEQKAALREAEQRASCTFFGLPRARCTFLHLWRDPAVEAKDLERLRQHVSALRPDLVFMPHGNDSNATHRRSYASFCTVAAKDRLSLLACLNQDAKTQGMRSDLFVPFDAPTAAWKTQLLRQHRSQQQRNLRTRGSGFDERVLQLNRDAATTLGLPAPYAEVFELQRFGGGFAPVAGD